ncbi:MAG: sulfite exporter TauE/SafE family protein [Niabella sp.]
MIQAVFTGLIMGLAGSFHCVGMCGPLALSLPLSNTDKKSRFFSALLYNLGRAATYFSMGSLLGWTGSRLALIGYQQYFSIAAGIVILALLIIGSQLPAFKPFTVFQKKLKKYLALFLKRENNASALFVFGLLNGLLPCGLVYMAVASALIIGSPLQSGIFMAAFGLGTLPLMILLMLSGRYISFPLRLKLKKFIPYFIAFVAVLMIIRGLNLGIPYISPAFSSQQAGLPCGASH